MTSMMSVAVVTSPCSTASSAILGIGRAEVVCCPEAVWLRHPHRPPTRQALTPKRPRSAMDTEAHPTPAAIGAMARCGKGRLVRKVWRVIVRTANRTVAPLPPPPRHAKKPRLMDRLHSQGGDKKNRIGGCCVCITAAACCAPGSWHVTTRACGGRQREPAWYCSYRVRCS